MKSYKIYAKLKCPYCMRLVKTLYEKKKTFYVEFLDAQPDRLEKLKSIYNHATVPIVILEEEEGERLIGGCDDTLEFLKNSESEDETV